MTKQISKAKKKAKAKKPVRPQFTEHAIDKMVERIITQAEIEEAITKGEYHLDEGYQFNVYYNNLRVSVREIPFSKKVIIITVRHDEEFEAELSRRAKLENRSIRSIVKELKNIEKVSRKII